MLEVNDISVAYGGFKALDGVRVSVGVGEFVSLVGPNGAGKSTLFRAISGTVPVISGGITFDGQNLRDVHPSDRPQLGIAHVPEGRQLFTSMTVIENLELGRMAGPSSAPIGAALDRVYSLFPVLAERRKQLAGTLSGGEQQMVAIARGVLSEPRLLMLDEPSMGLSPALAEKIFEAIAHIHRDEKIAVLLVEQRVGEAIDLADRSFVMDLGRIALDGIADAKLQSAALQRAYFGIDNETFTTGREP